MTEPDSTGGAEPAGSRTDHWIVLDAEGTRVAVDRRTGAIVHLAATVADGTDTTGWRVQDASQHASGFQLLVPLPGRRNNPVHGEEQPPPQVDAAADGTAVRLVWPEVHSRYGGTHAIRVEQRFSVQGPRVVVETDVDNRSAYPVENVSAPCLGGVRPPAPDEEMHAFWYSYGTAQRTRLWPGFDNNCGYWGVDHPTQLDNIGSRAGIVPVSPFLLVLARDQGLYVGVAERRDDLVAWRAELTTGYEDSMHQRAPAGAAVRLSVVHLPFLAPGQSRTLTPVVLRTFQGDWHTGCDIYRSWRDTWMTRPPTPAWAGEPHSWLQLHINSPEDELRIPFRELPRVGEECAAAGIRAIQLVGWADGGQDRGNPSHRPDPRLGTFEELRDAIRTIQALGVRVVLFSKFTWADRTSPRFGEFAGFTVKDPYGDSYNGAAYAYQTTTQLLGINIRHLLPMCFGSEGCLDACEREFDNVVRLGADGMLYDESQHHADALLCFDAAHGHAVPWPVYGHDGELVRRFRGRTAHAPDFLYCGEGAYDWQFADYDLSYFRSASREHLPVNRYLFPHAPLMTAATGTDDRNMINQCLMYRYLVSYEPLNFKGMPSDMPRTVAYGRRMDALRTGLRAWLWDGTFRDTLGAQVHDARGAPHRPYAVFLHRETGEPAIVVVNYDDTPVTVGVEGLGPRVAYRLVDDEQWRSDGTRVELPPRSAAVALPAAAARALPGGLA